MQGRNYRQVEAEFFRSLVNLCTVYDLPLPETSHLHFPQNVTFAYRQVKESVKQIDKNADCIILKDDIHHATLAVLKSYDTGRCLYYIPVRPLWNLVQDDKCQHLADMLLPVYAYLYQIAKLPYYTEPGSYMYYQYETLQNWMDDADDGCGEEAAYREEQSDALQTLENAGNRLLTQIRENDCLLKWEENIQTYRQSDGDSGMVAMAADFLDLFKAYPHRSLFDNIRSDLIDPGETERIRPEQYISFYWSSDDCFYDMLFDMVNNEFQECGITDEPVTIQLFDTPQPNILNDLDFEKRLFDLIDKLCELLAPYDHE